MQKIILASLLCLLPTSLLASGLSKPVLIGPKATGMGGAFVAIADDPTAIFHNPAGMTQMEGHNITAGMDALITKLDYTPPGGTVEKAKGEFLPVPLFGYVTDYFEHVHLGIGLFFPHGNGGKFTTPSAVPTNPNEGRIYSMEIAPAVAFKFNDRLSIGASLRFTRISTNTKDQIINFGGSLLNIDELDASGWGFGGSVGLLGKITERLSFGVNYRTKIKKTLKGSIAATDVASTTNLGSFDLDFKQQLPTLMTMGLAYDVTDNFTLSTMWGWEWNSEIDSFEVKVKNFPISPTTNATVTLNLPQNWTDSHTLHFGGEYWVLPEELALRAGYAKDFNSSIPDAVMNRIVGDVAAHETSAGIAYQYGRYGFGATWNARFGSRTIPNNGTNPGPGKTYGFIQSINVAAGISL